MKKFINLLVIGGTLCTLSADMQKEKNYNFFVGASLNYNKLEVTKKDQVGEILLNNSLDDAATSLGVQVGTRIAQNYVASLNYEKVNLDAMKMQSLYLSFDYQFDNILHPFIGASVGISYLEWLNDPLVNSSIKDNKLSSLMYGIQAGAEYMIDEHWSLYSILSYQKLDLTTELISSPAKAEVQYEDKSSVGVGIRYNF
ncbi:MAG: opacity family porin [Sulfurimonas sp.]|nr:opacity family porin [Sulfurimonas sp.]